jgi:DNA-binding response OmpR family regulator
MKSVLIIDDHEDAAAAIARIVAAAGAAPTVMTESPGFAAAFRALSPQAVILDVMMPDQDGIEVLRELAAIAPATPVLIVTGHGEVWARMARELGTILGLTHVEMAAKPVTRAAVLDFLRCVFADLCPG